MRSLCFTSLRDFMAVPASCNVSLGIQTVAGDSVDLSHANVTGLIRALFLSVSPLHFRFAVLFPSVFVFLHMLSYRWPFASGE